MTDNNSNHQSESGPKEYVKATILVIIAAIIALVFEFRTDPAFSSKPGFALVLLILVVFTGGFLYFFSKKGMPQDHPRAKRMTTLWYLAAIIISIAPVQSTAKSYVFGQSPQSMPIQLLLLGIAALATLIFSCWRLLISIRKTAK